jgi:phage-related minor tail protein
VAVGVGLTLGRKEWEEYQRVLILSGNAAGTTATQLAGMARAIASGGPITQGKAAEVLAQIAGSGDVAATSLQRYTRAAIEMERAGGPAAEETAKAFSALARDPLQASIKLAESTRHLTAATAEQIKTLEQQGRHIEAARLAQDAYADAIEERTPQMVQRLSYVEYALLKIKDAAKAVGSAIMEFGRPTDPLQKAIDDAEGRLAQNNAERPTMGDYGRAAIDRGNEKLTARLRLLQQGAGYEALSAAYQAQQVKQEEASVRWLKESEKYLSAQQKLGLEVLRIRNEGVAAGRSEAEIAERIEAAKTKALNKDTSAGDKERERALERQARLLAELSGVSGTYAQDLKDLDAARRAGNVSEERYGELVRELVKQQPIVKRLTEEQAKAQQAHARTIDQVRQQHERYLGELDRNLEAGDRQIDQLKLEYIELTAGKRVRLEVEAVERERLALTYEQTAAVEGLADAERARYLRLAAQQRELAALRRGLAAATDQKEVRDANKRAAEEAARDWERTTDQIGQSLADAIMRGGKGAGQLLKDYFRTLVLQPTIKAIASQTLDAVGQSFGFTGAAGGAQASAAGGGNAVGSALSSIGSALGLSKLAGSIGGFAKAISGPVQAALIGRAVGQAISGGYSVGGSPNRAVNIGLALLGPLGAIAGGVVNRLFGKKLKDTGFEGTFGAEGDFSGNAFQFFKGGLFRSDKTKRSPLDDALAAVLDAGGTAAFQQAQAYAKALNLPVEALQGFTQKIKVSLKGLSEEEARAAIEKSVAGFQEALIGRYATQLEPLRKVGETLTQTAERLATLQGFTRDLNELGGVFGRIAGLSVSAREQLITLAGGMEQLQQQALSFVQQYYSREEIAGIKAREIQAVLAAAGVGGDVNTRGQFRALVDNTDVSTEAGRQRLAQLLAIAGDFAQVADYLAETGLNLAAAARQAPASGSVADLFAQPQQAQIDAINGVTSAVGRVEAAIDRLTQIMQEARQAVFDPQWEVGGA